MLHIARWKIILVLIVIAFGLLRIIYRVLYRIKR